MINCLEILLHILEFYLLCIEERRSDKSILFVSFVKLKLVDLDDLF